MLANHFTLASYLYCCQLSLHVVVFVAGVANTHPQAAAAAAAARLVEEEDFDDDEEEFED